VQTSTLISTLTDEGSGATFLRPCTERLRRMPFGFRLGRDPHAAAPTVALSAVTIRFVATSGRETMEGREAATSSIVAVARSAMKRCVAKPLATARYRSKTTGSSQQQRSLLT
jgi:hypothetical protein